MPIVAAKAPDNPAILNPKNDTAIVTGPGVICPNVTASLNVFISIHPNRLTKSASKNGNATRPVPKTIAPILKHILNISVIFSKSVIKTGKKNKLNRLFLFS